MIVGKVVGTIWGAKKASGLEGLKLLKIKPVKTNNDIKKKCFKLEDCELSENIHIAADTLGAHIGEYVIVAHGTRVRNIIYGSKLPVKSIVIGIVDSSNLMLLE